MPKDSNTEFLMAALRKHGGEAAVVVVQAAFGGIKIKVPVTDKSNGKFVQILGAELASAVSKEICVRDADGRAVGAFRAYIPMGPKSRNIKLQKQIEALRKAGVPVQEIAIRVGCSERTVFRRIGHLEKPDTLVRKQEAAKQRRDEVLSLARAGAGLSEICKKVKLSGSVVRGHLERGNGIIIKDQEFKELRQRIIALREEGLSYSEIGRRLGVHRATVGYHHNRAVRLA